MIRTSWYYYVSIVLMTKPVVVVILLLWFFYRMMIAEKKPKGEREKVHSKTLLQLDSVLPFFACGLLPRPIHDVWVTTLFQALMEQHIVLSKNHSDHHHQTAWSAKCGLGPASLWSAAASCVSAEYPLP